MRRNAEEDGDMWRRGPVSGRQVELEHTNICDVLGATELLLRELEYLPCTTAAVPCFIHITSPAIRKSREEWP
jgi:hypothetical protein